MSSYKALCHCGSFVDVPYSDQFATWIKKHNECARSHPHENMDAICELKTEIARLTNTLENMRLKEHKDD